MIVLDASALVALWSRDTVATSLIAKQIAEHDHDIWAPLHFKIESAQAVRKQFLRKQISREQVVSRLTDLAEIEVTSMPTEVLLPSVARYLDNATAYDAAYVALAELLDCPLLTADKRIADIPGIQAKVLVV